MATGFNERLIESAELTSRGVELGVRLPWYRTLPLSTVEIAALRLDGKDIPADAINLALNGRSFPLAQLCELPDEWWYVLDTARLQVDAPGISEDSQHDVELTLVLYPPYIPGLRWVATHRTSCARRVEGQS